MSTDKNGMLRTPVNGGKAVLAASAAGDENKPAEPKAGPEGQVSTSPGISALTDNTKRFRLSNSQEQATPEGPGMSQQKARKGAGSSFATDEKPKKSVFPIRLTRNKKEKHSSHEKTSLPNADSSHKGKPTLVAKEECRHPTQRPLTEVPQAIRPNQDSCRKEEIKPSAFSSPVGSSVDYEEDMYRDAEEIEREKELLVCGTGTSVFPENKLSVAPEVDIMDYCQKEWRGNTSSAKRMRKLPEKLMAKYDWITEWQKLTGKAENWTDEIKECLLLLKQKWESISEAKTLAEKQAACDELFRGEEDEYDLYEAVKFLMLNTAIKLYEDNEKGVEVPEFSWLLFARDTSSNPFQLMKNHLNQLGHTGGLEQVEMFLLAYALQHSIHVYRLYKYGTDEFITLYPNHPREGWPVVTLITEDDRHYNIPVRVCEETSF